MEQCQSMVMKGIKQVLFNSGHFINQQGLFLECNLNPGSTYSLVTMKDAVTHLPNGMFVGLCLPEACNQDIIRGAMDMTFSAMNMSIRVNEAIMHPQEIEQSRGFLFYFTIILLCIFTILTIITLFLRPGKKQKTPMKILQCFNFMDTMKIFKHKPNSFNVFNGVKSIAMFWVIFGHQFSIRLKNVVNVISVSERVTQFFFLFATAAFFAVDVFFCIGGFLVAFSFLREHSKSPLKYPLGILHRVLRFWPSYIMAIFIYYSIYMQTGSGPFWWENISIGQINGCQNMWEPLLFVDNLVDNGETMCLGWGWYLQNDMQIFIFCTFLLFIYSKHRLASIISMVVTIIASSILNIVLVQINGYVHVTHLVDFQRWNQYFTNIYIKPWIRCPPYLIGLLVGITYMEYLAVKKIKEKNPQDPSQHFFEKLKAKLQNSKPLLYAFQIIGVALMLFVVLIPRTMQVGMKWPQILHSFYLSLGKTFFVIGMLVTLLPSLLQIKNMTFFLMDTRFFNFISKISFWTYLIHYMVVLYFTYSQKVDFNYTKADILPIYIGVVTISVALGFMGTILVEVPFSKLEKMLFSVFMPQKRPQKKKEEIKTQLLTSDSSNTQSTVLTNNSENSLSLSIKERQL